MEILELLNMKVYDLPVYSWILVAAILLTQATWLFIDARKRNANQWFWGIIGLIQCPVPLILYLFIVRKIYKRKRSEK
jgi:cytochrome bd-type quinol oxidase subunit 2